MKRSIILKEIIWSAVEQGLSMKQIDGAGKDTIEGICRREWGRTYKEIRIAYACGQICGMVRRGESTAVILREVNISQCSDSSMLRRFAMRYMLPMSRLRILFGGERMTENMEIVWNYLIGRKCRITAHEISVGTGLSKRDVAQAIGKLREAGVAVISVPGRYGSGYRINDPARAASEEWINNWRCSRGLTPNFSYS